VSLFPTNAMSAFRPESSPLSSFCNRTGRIETFDLRAATEPLCPTAKRPLPAAQWLRKGDDVNVRFVRCEGIGECISAER